MAASPVTLHWTRGAQPDALREREWLATNGLGGYASASVLGIPTRHYHGLFVPNLTEPTGRFVCVPRVDELVTTSQRTVNLGGAEFAEAPPNHDAATYLREFQLATMIPTWVFDIDGTVLEKSIVMPQGQNSSYLRYRVLEGPGVRIRVRVFGAARRLSAHVPRDDAWPFVPHLVGHNVELRTALGITVRILAQPASPFHLQRQIDYNVLYSTERDRGYDHLEHLHSPGYFDLSVTPEGSAAVVFSTESWDVMAVPADALFEAESARQHQLMSLARAEDDVLAQHLTLAADQFIVTPGSRRDEALLAVASGSETRSVIAGYHWFNDWGRDTMIAFEGLTLCTGRHREARAILRTFSHYIKDGLLPNLFPEGAREAQYHTVDATLWYFHAIDRYLAYTHDPRLIEELYPILQSIIGHHLRGTHFGIAADPRDGLLAAGAEGYQLTWMDAKFEDAVITPRRGKPVEIQALWYNALQCMATWGDMLGVDGGYYRSNAERVQESFNARFWNAETASLYDVIDGPDGNDASVRPNQIFALSLSHCVLDYVHWAPVLDIVTRHLLTPYGLRTLSPHDVRYQGHYSGDLRTRDSAYHQGTVWPWLLGAYVDAVLRVRGDTPATRVDARRVLAKFPAHLGEAGVGSISEIFDGEAPHTPRGTIAQAWSVAEILRVWRRTRGAAVEAPVQAGARVVEAAGPGYALTASEPTGEEDTYAGLVSDPVGSPARAGYVPTASPASPATGEEDPLAGLVDAPVAEGR
ncbi:MAG: amylo-alpha-1,6-glucosidase [Rhodocyclaceae bacterium]